MNTDKSAAYLLEMYRTGLAKSVIDIPRLIRIVDGTIKSEYPDYWTYAQVVTPVTN